MPDYKNIHNLGKVLWDNKGRVARTGLVAAAGALTDNYLLIGPVVACGEMNIVGYERLTGRPLNWYQTLGAYSQGAILAIGIPLVMDNLWKR